MSETPTPDLTERAREEALDLDEIEARATAATDGPWEYDDLDGVRQNIPATAKRRASFDLVAEVYRDGDGEFIAHARQDVPALIAEVRRLRPTEQSAAHDEQVRREAKAEAWDEGRESGICDVDTSGYGGVADTPNPYRDGGAR